MTVPFAYKPVRGEKDPHKWPPKEIRLSHGHALQWEGQAYEFLCPENGPGLFDGSLQKTPDGWRPRNQMLKCDQCCLVLLTEKLALDVNAR